MRSTESPPERSPAPHTILVHGLARSRYDMLLLRRRLQRIIPETKIHLFDYASRRGRLNDFAEQLGSFAQRVSSGESVSFVGHSLGGIVVRVLDQDVGHELMMHRLITLGSPHGGAAIARVLHRFGVCRALFGPALGELGKLELPPESRRLEIGCVVGCTNRRWGFFPVFGEDNDGVVLRREAELSTSKEIVYRPVLHALFPFSNQISELTARFLVFGSFTNTHPSPQDSTHSP